MVCCVVTNRMSDAKSVESPIEAAAEVVGNRVTEAFSLLGNETRLAILLALWEAHEPFPGGTWDPTGGTPVSFSALHDRVGVGDSGQFNYHLGKLEGHFVEQTSDGYQLLPAGQKLVRTVIADAGFEDPRLDPVEVDIPCHLCGGATMITYQNQRLYHVCTVCEGAMELGEKHPSSVLSALGTNPNILRERTPEEIYSTVKTEVHHAFALRVGGVCTHCSGHLDALLDVCDDHAPGDVEPCPACERPWMAMVRYVCTDCKHTSTRTIEWDSLCHPAGVAFAWKHGIELGYGIPDMEIARWRLDVEFDQELVATDPPLVRVTLAYEGEAIHLTFDEALTVVEVNEEY